MLDSLTLHEACYGYWSEKYITRKCVSFHSQQEVWITRKAYRQAKEDMQWTCYTRRDGKKIRYDRPKKPVWKTAAWVSTKERREKRIIQKKVKWAFPIWGNRQELFISVLSSMTIKIAMSICGVYKAKWLYSHQNTHFKIWSSTNLPQLSGAVDLYASPLSGYKWFCRPKERESKCQKRQMDSTNSKWWTPRPCKRLSPCRWSTEQATLCRSHQRWCRCCDLSMGIEVHKTLLSNRNCCLRLCTWWLKILCDGMPSDATAYHRWLIIQM